MPVDKTPVPTTEELLARIERLEYAITDALETLDSAGRRHRRFPHVVAIRDDVDERRRVYQEARDTERLEAALAARRGNA
ncbi:MAG: hypothetical protein WB565_10070 [Acidimicrobiales bacterium]